MKKFVIDLMDGKTKTIEADICLDTTHLIKFVLGTASDGVIVMMVHQSFIKSVFVNPQVEGARKASESLGLYVTDRRMN